MATNAAEQTHPVDYGFKRRCLDELTTVARVSDGKVWGLGFVVLEIRLL